MVRMLRIAGLGALIFSGLVLVSVLSPVHIPRLGISGDGKAQAFLNAPSAVERFNSLRDPSGQDGRDKTPPLVRQATSLEKIIRPRPDVAVNVASGAGRIRTPITSPPRSRKFDLIGISYSPSDPQSSFAFIRWPDNTYQWVQQGSQAGHLTVQQIRSDSIICSDGQRTSEEKMQATADTSSLLEAGASLSAPAASATMAPAGMRAAGYPRLQPPQPVAAKAVQSVTFSDQDKEAMDELMQRVKQKLRRNPEQVDSSETAGQSAEAIGELISEFKASRVGTQEAQQLETLGEQLNGAAAERAREKHREFLRRMSRSGSAEQ